ncbi:MAG: Fe-S cluster assembly scaffold protein NifU [candidate division WOR-3 bacterium]
MYSEKVMEHFRNPRNVGEIENADGVGEVGNPVCGDMMTFYIKVENDIITDVKFKTFGCGAAIAVSSMVSEMAKGKTIEEALKITNEQVAKELGGLPPNKMHCSNLGADALHAAIQDYLQRRQQSATGCRCPYCDRPLTEGETVCQPCQTKINFCPHCGKPLPRNTTVCPECGGKIDK